MMTSRRWIVTSSVACVVLLTHVAPLRADTITILSPATEPLSVSILGDTFTLFGSSVSVDLDLLMSRGRFTLPIQRGNLSVGNSGFANQVFDIFVPQRQVIVGGVTRGVIISGGQLSITPTIDTLTLFGFTVPFDISPTQRLTLTVDQVVRSATVVGDFPFEVTGTLSLTSLAATPEPTSLLLLGTGLVGLVARVRMRRT